MDRRHAEPQRRLGLLRRRQHALLSEPHPVRRSRRAARPADRRCQRPLPRASCASSATAPSIRRSPPAIAFLRREQEADGSWFGRWGTNYIYGTWSVLAALNAAGIDPAAPEIRRAVAWLLARQRADGGWGEAEESTGPDRAAWRGALQHRLADRLGIARADGGRRGRQSGGGPRHRLSDRDAERRAEPGTSRGSPRSAFRACFFCAITATASISRSGRWPAIAV